MNSISIRGPRQRSFLPSGLRKTRGVAALEFALVTPLFLALLFAIVVYGLYFATWIAVTEAASEGARASLAGLSTDERQSLATSAVDRVFASYAPLLAVQNVTVSFPPPPNANLFAVALTYDFTSANFESLASFVPLPSTKPTITVTVSNGGY